MKASQAVKNAVPKIVPQINVELADRLLRAAEEKKRKAQQEVAPIAVKPAPAKSRIVSAKVSHPVSVPVKLFAALVDEPQKINPVWGWANRKDDESSLHLGATLNLAHEPTRSFVATNNLPMIRWLICVAIVERALYLDCYEAYGPLVRRHLWAMAGVRLDSRWDSLGVAYRLSLHEVSAPIAALDWRTPLLSQKFTEFEAKAAQRAKKAK
jgi:hypothetical protein